VKAVVVGAGAIGGALAAFAAADGVELTVVDSSPDHVAAIRSAGLHVGGIADFTVRIDVRAPDELDFGYDAAVMATGMSALPAALAYIEPHLSRRGCVVTVQNGLAAYDAAAILGADHVLPGCVTFAGVVDGPGRIRLAAPGPLHVGEFEGVVSRRVRDVVDVFRAFDSVQADDNVWGFIWAKLAIAAGFVALAVDGRPNLEIYSDPAARDPLCAVYAEVAATAQASGVNLESIKGIDIDPLGRWPALPTSYLDELFAALFAAAGLGAANKPYSGIHDSIAAGQPTEAYVLLEPVIAQADRLGCSATRLRRLLDTLRLIEAGRVEPSPGLLRSTVGQSDLKGARL
jgi:2-dehydropantoate 2-reductase